MFPLNSDYSVSFYMSRLNKRWYKKFEGGFIMQTFLPYADFKKSVACLDKKRLMSQQNECFVILDIHKKLIREHKTLGSEGLASWEKHPVTRMWWGHTRSLLDYLLFVHARVCTEFVIGEETASRVYEYLKEMHNSNLYGSKEPPEWFGGFIHENHQAKLLSKNPDHYGQFGWEVNPDERSWYPVEWGPKNKIGYGVSNGKSYSV